MSKRVRTLETLGSLPYTTVDGGKWLKKALDPVDLDVEVQGLPDTSTNARCVLNYQFQGDIPPPHSNTYIATSTQSYDVDFYVFQNPVTLGMSASRPAGTKNPINVGINVTSANGHMSITLPNGYAPSTVQIFENPQIEGETKNEKLMSLQRYCQRYRMIYGGVQCIPACSALFDSGTIEATQQIFSPQEKNINDELVLQQLTTGTNENPTPPPIAEAIANFSKDNVVKYCQRFEKDDFPDEGSSIQNPAALFCRYKEGLYMPYKIRNPLVYEYKSSEKRVVTEAPYIITDRLTVMGVYNNDPNTPSQFVVDSCVYDPQINGWKTLHDIAWSSAELWFHCVSKTGVPFYIVLRNIGSDFALPEVVPTYHSENFAQYLGPSNQNYMYVMGAGFTASNTASEVLGKSGAILDIPYKDNNIGIICFRSIGLQASIRVIFRFGLEMMITAGSVYTPFKHKSPKYDQKALNSYIQATHNMRDAFLGNAATPEGHAAFAAHIAAIAATGDSGYVSNNGSRWYGQVSV